MRQINDSLLAALNSAASTYEILGKGGCTPAQEEQLEEAMHLLEMHDLLLPEPLFCEEPNVVTA